MALKKPKTVYLMWAVFISDTHKTGSDPISRAISPQDFAWSRRPPTQHLDNPPGIILNTNTLSIDPRDAISGFVL